MSRAPSALTVARLMTIGRDELSKAETVTVAAIESGVESLVEAREVRGLSGDDPKNGPSGTQPWIERAKTSLVAALANGVTKDKAAVSGALSSGWSNGQAEGQICKLKLIKRQMYGRGKRDLPKRASSA
jgi:transposase